MAVCVLYWIFSRLVAALAAVLVVLRVLAGCVGSWVVLVIWWLWAFELYEVV